MKAGIVGGGMLGLYLAHRLRQAGWEVTLLEGAPEPGGLASAWQIGPYTWDKYYHVISLSDTILRSFLAKQALKKPLYGRKRGQVFIPMAGFTPCQIRGNFLPFHLSACRTNCGSAEPYFWAL